MNKKDEIRFLRGELQKRNSENVLLKAELESIQLQSTQRGARMEVLMEWIDNSGLVVPNEFDPWFNNDGTTKL